MLPELSLHPQRKEIEAKGVFISLCVLAARHSGEKPLDVTFWPCEPKIRCSLVGLFYPVKITKYCLLKAAQRKGCLVKCPCGVMLSVLIFNCFFP